MILWLAILRLGDAQTYTNVVHGSVPVLPLPRYIQHYGDMKSDLSSVLAANGGGLLGTLGGTGNGIGDLNNALERILGGGISEIGNMALGNSTAAAAFSSAVLDAVQSAGTQLSNTLKVSAAAAAQEQAILGLVDFLKTDLTQNFDGTGNAMDAIKEQLKLLDINAQNFNTMKLAMDEVDKTIVQIDDNNEYLKNVDHKEDELIHSQEVATQQIRDGATRLRQNQNVQLDSILALSNHFMNQFTSLTNQLNENAYRMIDMKTREESLGVQAEKANKVLMDLIPHVVSKVNQISLSEKIAQGHPGELAAYPAPAPSSGSLLERSADGQRTATSAFLEKARSSLLELESHMQKVNGGLQVTRRAMPTIQQLLSGAGPPLTLKDLAQKTVDQQNLFLTQMKDARPSLQIPKLGEPPKFEMPTEPPKLAARQADRLKQVMKEDEAQLRPGGDPPGEIRKGVLALDAHAKPVQAEAAPAAPSALNEALGGI